MAMESNWMLIRRPGKGIRNDLGRLPSGQSPREAKVRHLEAGPLHNNLKKGGMKVVGWDKLKMIVIDSLQNVKKILLMYG
jgi:hypothetical protein